MTRQDIKRRKEAEKMEVTILLDCLLAFMHDVEARLGVSLERDRQTVSTRVQNEGMHFLGSVLPSFWKFILDSLDAGKLINALPRFKCGVRADRPAFLQKLTNQLFDIDGNVIVSEDEEAEKQRSEVVRLLNTLHNSFGKKYERPLSPIQIEDQLQAFFTDDEELPVKVVSDQRWLGRDALEILKHARAALVELFENYELPEVCNGTYALNTHTFWDGVFQPSFGAGAVFEGYDAYDKYSRLFTCPPLKAIFPLDLLDTCRPSPQSSIGYGVEIVSPQRMLERERNGGYSGVIIVPKTADEGREIMLQENDLLFLQQGARKKLYKWVESHPLTRGRVNFTNQEINGRLALSGSADRSWCTLDVKKASNNVSKEHVGILFDEKVAEMLLLLRNKVMCVRNSEGKITMQRDMNMYAAMGSALCFPVEALVFWAVARAALRLAGLDYDAVYVYGDDIVVPNDGYEVVAMAFGLVGFIVNRKKSFHKGFFRESCGVDAYRGRRVDPAFRISKRVPLADLEVTPSKRVANMVAWVEYANLAEAEDYVFLADAIRGALFYSYERSQKYPQTGDITEINKGFLAFYVQGRKSLRQQILDKIKETETVYRVKSHNPLVLEKIVIKKDARREKLIPEVPQFRNSQGHFFGQDYQDLTWKGFAYRSATETYSVAPEEWYGKLNPMTIPEGLRYFRWMIEQPENSAAFPKRDSLVVVRERVSLS